MINKVSRFVHTLQLHVGIICITIFFVTILIQVFCRYTGITVLWTGEVSTYAFIWAVFMGAGAMTYENKHFAFTSMVDKLSGTKRVWVKICISFIMMIFTIATLYYGIIIAKKFWNYRWINLPEVKMGYTMLCIPVFGFTSTLYCITHISEYLKDITFAYSKLGKVA